MDVGRENLELQKLRDDRIARLQVIRDCLEQLCLLTRQLYEGEVGLQQARTRSDQGRLVPMLANRLKQYHDIYCRCERTCKKIDQTLFGSPTPSEDLGITADHAE